MVKKILIVEDDFYIRDLYLRAFRKAGYLVTTVANGKEALGVSEEGDFEVILLDIMLPEVTGIEVLEYLRRRESSAKNTPVFLVTNLGQEDIIKKAFKLGADGYLLKAQLTPGEVVREVEAFLKEREKEKLSDENKT